MTVNSLILSALRLLNVYAGGDTAVDLDDLNDALGTFNDLLSSWNAQHLTVYTIVNRTHILTPAQGSYLMGTEGDIDTARPVKIESAGTIQPNGLRTPLKLIGSTEWARIEEKALQARQPLALYNDNNYPLVTLYLWPIPSGAPTLDLNVWEELTAPMGLSDGIDLPPSYARALRFALAVDLALEFGRDPAPFLPIAQAAKQELFALNASNETVTEDPVPPAEPAPRA